ncbi:MAG: DUF3293 domain-containing protein [Gammaproteobacteria bacterium]
MATVNDELKEAYRATDYNVHEPWSLTLKIGEPSPDLKRLYHAKGVCSAAFLTAYNPHSQCVGPDENEAAQQALQHCLQESGLEFCQGSGDAVSGEWREPSFLVLGITREEALRLGREFGQNAVVWVERDGIPELVRPL